MKKFVLVAVILLCGNFVFANCARVFKLDNGQTVVIQEIHNNPIVTIDTWIKTGSIDEDDTNNGVAHFLEHLFFKGTEKHKPGEFDKILETKGAITNAATSKDFTHYYITLPSSHFDLAMELHADMLSNPAIPYEDMEKERKVVIEEINKDINSPNNILMQNLDLMLYSNHPYKRRVIGRSDVIENISRDNIFKFYNTHYSPSNMTTIVIGDIDTEHALEQIQKNFNKNYQKPQKINYPRDKQLTQQKKKVQYTDVESGYMLIGFKSTPIVDKDSYALDVLSTILGDGHSSVLNQELKEKKQIAFSVSAGNSTYKDDGIFYVRANFEPKKCKLVQDTVFEEINKIQQNGVSDEQLKLAQNIIERNTYYSRESVSNISNEIGYTITLTGDMKFYNEYLNNIKKVTKEDVKRVAQKYLGINRSAISIVLPENAKNIEISHNQKYRLISQNTQTQKYKLSNGSTLLYTPNDSNDIIAISIYAKGGQLLENKGGVGTMTALTMMKGTKNYSALELAQTLEDNGIKISPSSSSDIFSVSVLTTKDEINKTLELLDEVVNNAVFDENEITKIKSEQLNNIKRAKDMPLQRALEEYRDLIFKDSPYSISSKILEKNITNITRDDITNYYNKIFYPQNLVISINGNIDKEYVSDKLNEIFANRTGQNQNFEYNSHNSRISVPTSPRITNQKMPTTQTAWIMLGWQTSGLLNQKEYATLEVIDTLLGSGMSSRLFIDLREKEGLAYQLGSGYSPHVLRGSFMLYIGTNPATLEKSKQGLFNEIKRLKTEQVTEKELTDAKEKLLGNYIISQETNLEKASLLGGYEALGLGYEFKNCYEQLINSVTTTDIIEVANKYFNDNYVLSIVSK